MTASTGTAQFGAEIPRRIQLIVDVPQRLNNQAISEVCNITASRVRFELSAAYRQQIAERIAARRGAPRRGAWTVPLVGRSEPDVSHRRPRVFAPARGAGSSWPDLHTSGRQPGRRVLPSSNAPPWFGPKFSGVPHAAMAKCS